MKYEITKEQIKFLYDNQSSISSIKANLEQWFPEAFEVELEAGRWYKRPHNKALFFVKEIISKTTMQVSCFGFDNGGDWMNGNPKTFPDNDILATDKEVEAALINEWKRLGGENVNVFIKIDNKVFQLTDEIGHYQLIGNIFFYQGAPIMIKGQWAEIIPTLTLKEAEEKLGVKIIS